MTTNGVFGEDLCRWAGDRFDTVVLSLDGPRDAQDRHRPGAGGRSAFATVEKNARILSDSPTELVLRACVSAGTVGRMDGIARWMAGAFRPATVCFEPLAESDASRRRGLQPPDPWEFARRFDLAAAFLDLRGIRAVASSAEPVSPRASFCPLGNDALIVGPDGAVNACYLLPSDWIRQGLDLRLGAVTPDGLAVDPVRVQSVRDLAAREKPLCAACFCRYACAGGCHVRHDVSRPAGSYDAFCIHTRLITLAGLLRRLGEAGLAERLLADRAGAERAALQPNDLLAGGAFA